MKVKSYNISHERSGISMYIGNNVFKNEITKKVHTTDEIESTKHVDHDL